MKMRHVFSFQDFPLMAWDEPPIAGTDVTAWTFLRQFWRAAVERAVAASAASYGYWPRGNWPWETGTITAITGTTLTDNTKTWDTAPQRWAGYDNTAFGAVAFAPASYDVIIGSCDPRQVIHTTITSNTATVLTIGDITQRITERVAVSLASLVGRKYTIIKRGGIWWSERVFQWPNDQVFAQGLVSDSAAGTPATLTATGEVDDSLVGLDVLFFNDAVPAVLQRGRITAVAGNALTFTGTSGAAAFMGYYFVVAADAYFQWGRLAGQPFAWYTGQTEGFYSHFPDDTLAVTGKPQASIELSLGVVAGSCPFPSTHDLFDIDLWTEINEACETPDHSFNPDLYFSFRSLQVVLEAFCTAFVDPTLTYDGAAAIALLTPATMFELAGINSQRATAGTHTGTGLPITLTVPWTPINVYWTVLTASGDVLTSGISAYNGTEIDGSFSADADGRTVVVSLGWTRQKPPEFQKMFGKTIFIADQNLGDDSVYQTPAEPDGGDNGPGMWVTRAASTHYISHSTYGHVGESSEAWEAFASGDLARYAGDNVNDPTLSPYDSSDAGLDPLSPYYDRFFVGERARGTQGVLNGQRSGQAEEGSTRHLSDTGQDWWRGDFYTGGELVDGSDAAHSGTATGGSTTSLTDSGQTSALWDETRSEGRWVGHTVQVLIDGADFDDPLAVIERRLITSHTGTTIGWDEPLSATANGKLYRIREPKFELNKFKDRRMLINKPDPDNEGATLSDTVTLAGNDDVTLFFTGAAAFAVDETTLYAIADPPVGGVWQWSGSAWFAPTGLDPRTGGVNFHKSQFENLPTAQKRYGRIMQGDYFFLQTFVEIYDVFNVLLWTKGGASWTTRAVDATPENNRNTGFSATGASGGFGTPRSEAETMYGGGTELTEASGAPYAYADLNDGDPAATLRRKYGYLTASAPEGACPITYEIEFYVYGWITDANPDAGGTDPVYTFDANGDVIGYRVWRNAGLSNTGTVTAPRSSKFGNVVVAPTWPTDPAEPPFETIRGYYVGNQCVILKWNFTYAD